MDLMNKGDQKLVKTKKAEPIKKVAKKPEESTRIALWHQVRQYLREVSFELRKVVWPSRKETIGSTTVVLVIVTLSAIYFGIVDAVLSKLVRLVIG